MRKRLLILIYLTSMLTIGCQPLSYQERQRMDQQMFEQHRQMHEEHRQIHEQHQQLHIHQHHHGV